MDYSSKTREIGDSIAGLTVIQAKELSEYLEKVHGIKPFTPPTAIIPKKKDEPIVEQTEFDVYMETYGANKIGIIKVIRQLLNLGLKEAKDFVESIPVKIKEGVSREEAEKIKKELEEAGATASIK